MTKEDYEKIGKSFTDRIFKTEVFEYDKLQLTHSIEFKLSVLDRTYTIAQPIDQINVVTANKIWMEIFSNVLADLNRGINEKETQK